MKIVLASNNSGKIREFQEFFQHTPFSIISQAECGVDEVEETGLSFIENALIKARYASTQTGLPAIADDSGLTVSALGGAPGIYSARYAGTQANASNNIKKLLEELKDFPTEQRHAAFYCALVFLLHAKDPTPLVCEGKWPGIILTEQKGNNGFGYDPIFYDPIEKKSAAELPLTKKNKISHRGIALQNLLKKLPERLND